VEICRIYSINTGNNMALFDRLLKQESGGKQKDAFGNPITSKKGAIGISQVMPATAPEAAKLAGLAFDAEKYRNDESYNKALGSAYLDSKLAQFGGDEDKALGAYNAGAGAVNKAIAQAKENGGSWLDYMPDETKNYVAKIQGGDNKSFSDRMSGVKVSQPSGLENVYQAYKSGKMSDEDKASFEQSIQAGEVNVPKHWRVERRAVPVANNNVLNAFMSGAMTPDDSNAFMSGVRKGEVSLPEGVTLDSMIAGMKQPEGSNLNPINAIKSAGRGALGIVEPAMTLGSGMLGMIPAIGSAVVQDITGTLPEGKTPQQVAEERVKAMTYVPRTESGQQGLQAIGEATNNEFFQKILPAIPMTSEMQAIGALAGGVKTMANPALARAGEAVAAGVGAAEQAIARPLSAIGRVMEKSAGGVKNAATSAAESTGNLARKVFPKDETFIPAKSVGAQATPREAQLAETSAQLGFTGEAAPTKGQLTGDFATQQFEGETAKNAARGEELRTRLESQNQRAATVLDDFIEGYDPKTSGNYERGEMVANVLGAQAKRDKQAVTALYDKAKAEGRMSDPVSVNSVVKFLDDSKSAEGNAPVLGAIRKEIDRLNVEGELAGTGSISINDMEELRKFARNNMPYEGAGAYYGAQAINEIDSVLNQAGGTAYRQARAAYKGYVDKYKNKAIVANILGTKRGTNDRIIALEDVFDKTILKGKQNDLVHLKTVLKSAGEDGDQALRELQAGWVEHLKEKAFSNTSSTDSQGLSSISTAKVIKEIRDMDKAGKLDVLMGKEQAQRIRDFGEVIQALNVKRPGAINTSNTASIMAPFIESSVSMMLTGLPFPAMTAIKAAVKMKNNAAVERAVKESLNYSKKF
jgi:hypothetical protein